MSASPPLASIVVVTHNRQRDVLVALESCYAQSYRPLEVLVYDDASADGTEQAVRQQFPDVRYWRADPGVGYIVLRNRGFRDARGKYVFSIDDDAYFSDAGTVSETVNTFESRPEVAAVALPYIEPRGNKRRAVFGQSPGDRLRTFIGCSHALRVAPVRELGGYRELYFHQGEERDLAIRLRDRGYEVVYGNTPPVVHTFSPRRDRTRLSYYGVRNVLLFDYLNLPLVPACGRLMLDAVQSLLHRIDARSVPWRLYCIAGGWLACVKYARHRRAVSLDAYRQYRSLPLHLPLPYSADAELPEVAGRARSAPAGEPETCERKG